MVSQATSHPQQVQRVQVSLEALLECKSLKISVENYDEGLGWYSAGSLTLPIHQLPLLEQALETLRGEATDPGRDGDKIIPFPALRR
jgi:hypothetical protein